MNAFKTYQRKGSVEARRYDVGDELDLGISFSQADREHADFTGGMIARNPNNHADRWFIARAFFEKNYFRESQ